ncbi:cytochrome-c peroxidase [Flavobacterium davisii]|uniref:cytochrome-c peroxidase n=1 Tax=Flavobacterium davisii TaxID=2906077 RepID=UPI0035D0FEE5
MKKIFILVLLLFLISCKKNSYNHINYLKNTQLLILNNYNKLIKEANKLAHLTKHNATQDELKKQFIITRLAFKTCEEFIAFYFPSTFTKINGAPINENDLNDSNRKIEDATGFQVVEETLFDKKLNRQEAIQNTATLQSYIQTLELQIQTIQLTDRSIFEIQKLQLIRIISLGISGFDSAIALQSLAETKSALKGIQSYINCFSFEEKLNKKIAQSIQFINQNQDFNSFNRAVFIVKYIKPIFEEINHIQQKLNIKNNSFISAIDFSKNSPFEKGAFNVNYFAPFYNRNPSKAQIALGKELFYDKILSGNQAVSCASCHIPEIGYADHKTTAVNHIANSRNTPTLLNSALQNNLFVDGRVVYLEDQAKAVINNKNEMHGSFKTALAKINSNPIYIQKFKKVFLNEKVVREQHVLKSLASFIRTLAPLNSRFDNYLQGTASLTSNETKGFNLFMGKGKCATCHFFPLFNGSVPPLYQKMESEVLGVPTKPNVPSLDPDLGEYLITQAPLKKYAFKTPTLRNAAITFPYMHNGHFKTLEEVLIFYNKGGGKGLGIHLKNQTLPEDNLNLSKQDIKDLISFIKTLNDI